MNTWFRRTFTLFALVGGLMAGIVAHAAEISLSQPITFTASVTGDTASSNLEITVKVLNAPEFRPSVVSLTVAPVPRSAPVTVSGTGGTFTLTFQGQTTAGEETYTYVFLGTPPAPGQTIRLRFATVSPSGKLYLATDAGVFVRDASRSSEAFSYYIWLEPAY